MEKKYICVGGNVTSKTDRQIHYISAYRLCELYGVDPRECALIDDDDTDITSPQFKGLRLLLPSYHGNYTLD